MDPFTKLPRYLDESESNKLSWNLKSDFSFWATNNYTTCTSSGTEFTTTIILTMVNLQVCWCIISIHMYQNIFKVFIDIATILNLDTGFSHCYEKETLFLWDETQIIYKKSLVKSTIIKGSFLKLTKDCISQTCIQHDVGRKQLGIPHKWKENGISQGSRVYWEVSFCADLLGMTFFFAEERG